MKFNFSDEQRMMQESVERFVADNYNLESRVALSATEQGFSTEYWQSMADLGWLGLPFDEADGGLGGNQIDIMVIMEQFGKGLVLEPYLASIVMGGGALRRGGSEALKSEMLPGVIDGSRQLAFAYAEHQARFDLDDVTTTARKDGQTFVITGQKSMVQSAATANQIVVSVRTSGGQVDQNGISLFLIDADTPGISREDFPTVDGLRASEVTFKDVSVGAERVLGELDNGFGILQAVANDAMLALGAEAVGAMEILYKDTVAYTQEREQFDHPLSDFQVLQHRMVDMFMEYEQCKSMLYRATMEAIQDPEKGQRTIHALMHAVGKYGIFIGENAVQLHGGMGVTEELRLGHYFKRMLVIDSMFGNADYHLQKFAA
ncbi:MAG: pimeloyl-CoA dehydrogenase small subunit [Gammaproteobacteria bacterium]|jgi:alkylation response protein AidB-like acyl-CoA dehydrogenase|nr:pimeloyl-CoA dehydrogenase small subunit [Gammaproteobacteria bacterium]MBT4491668.1 pimeloyl-CoA dehydrogenase small subunit [Gammaproteobacteria bacterium]